MTVEFKDYAEYINKSCPDCGENLLTETCIDNVLSYIRSSLMVNSMIHKILPQSLLKKAKTLPKVEGKIDGTWTSDGLFHFE